MQRRHGKRPEELRGLLKRDHTLNGGILYGIDGSIIEIQARAIEVLKKPVNWDAAVDITGMATGAVATGARSRAGAPQRTDERLDDP